MNKAEYTAGDTLLSKTVNILLGVGKGYIVSVVMLFILSLIVTYTSFSESLSDFFVSAISIIGIVWASVCVAKRYRTFGWLHGVITGVVYNLILYVFSSVFLSFSGMQKSVVPFIVTGVICGVIGGIIGVNLRRR